MRSRIAIGALCLLLAGGTGAAPAGKTTKPTNTAVKAGTKPAGKVFVSKPGRFSVVGSGTPQEQKQSVETTAGPVPVTMYLFHTKTSTQFASYADYPPGSIQAVTTTSALDGARDGFVRNVRGTLLNEREITYHKHPGREFRVAAPGGLLMLARVYLVGSRLYQLVVVARKDQFAEEEARKFLQSFALVK